MKHFPKSIKIILVLSLIINQAILFCPLNAAAQDTITGALQGEVLDEVVRTPIPGVTVTILDEVRGVHYNLLTDSKGRFFQSELSPGLYTITFESPKYQKVVMVRRKVSLASAIFSTPITLVPLDNFSATYLGQVFDRFTESPVGGVEVRFRNADQGTQFVLKTDSNGKFSKASLAPGNYSIEFSATGYEPRRLEQKLFAAAITTPASPLGFVLLTPVNNEIQPNNPSLKKPVPRIDFGEYHALIIGNNDYRGRVSKLQNAVNDATAVDEILRKKFGFLTKLLINAKGDEIIGAINTYRTILKENDNLLIFYAGHGVRDDAGEAWWVPVDAKDAEDNTTWVSSTVHIVNRFKGTKARHILVISDSCFSGAIDLNRQLERVDGSSTERERFLRTLVEGKSRVLIASGGNEPVLDGRGGKHSIFTKALLNGLEKMEENVFTAAELFRSYIEQQVSGNAKQTPELKSLRDSGHVKGHFIFVRKQ